MAHMVPPVSSSALLPADAGPLLPRLPLAHSMLICSVFSRPQLNAVLGKMTKEAAEVHGRHLSVQPTGT